MVPSVSFAAESTTGCVVALELLERAAAFPVGISLQGVDVLRDLADRADQGSHHLEREAENPAEDGSEVVLGELRPAVE